MAQLLADFPSGPLDTYRKKASFDWKKLKIFLDTEEILEFQAELYDEFKKHPILFPESWQTPTLNEEKRIANLRMFVLKSLDVLAWDSLLDNLRKPAAAITAMFQLDPATVIKHSVGFGMFPSVFHTLGTELHSHYFDESMEGNIIGAYCLTEIGHGSNAKAMRTTATFDKETQEFIMHTPDFEAAKCWAGLLGRTATYALIYAQLVTPDGANHSLHAFLVPIRDPKTLIPYPGVTVGDMGEKIGLNGIDNGFVMFNQYRIPKSALLNKTGDVTEDGKYVSPFKDPNKRYGASLGTLSIGRVNITCMCGVYAAHALAIAIRYAAVRKQFGPENAEEVPIIEYQTHQHRLLPYLAVAYVVKMFSTYLMEIQYQFLVDSVTKQNKDNLVELGLELHAISSACKPVAGWVVRDGVQECREACGGHGYLKISGLGDIKNAQDANCTYEGENHILIQQTSNWLLKLWPLVLQGQKVSSPLKSLDFLTYADKILKLQHSSRSVEDFIKPENVLNVYKWLTCYLLKMSYEKCETLIKRDNLDQFWAKNEAQVYFCRNLGVVYIQHFMLERIYVIIQKATDPSIRTVLTKLFQLYGVWSLENHLPTVYRGGYARDPSFATLVQDSILKLCRDLKDDAVTLVDVIAPPDFLIKSVLGRSDGQVYKHLEAAMLQSPDALARPTWWKEVVNWKDAIKSKL